MNPNAAFDRDLERWLQAEAPSSEPAHLHETVIERARTVRQRPRWVAALSPSTFPRLVPEVDRSTVRVAYLLVLLALVLAVLGGAIAAGVFRPDPVRPAVWVESGALTAARDNHTATLLPDGRVLVAGGLGVATAELYDPKTRSWTATGSMLEARENHTATLLPDGKVLVVGGNDIAATGAAFSLGSAELYDPATGSWTATGSMLGARVGHSATLLLDSRVLVSGGALAVLRGDRNAPGDPPAAAEVYDPATETWTTTGSLIEPREGHTATRLPDGRVLVAGGLGLSNPPYLTLASAELYDPGSRTWVAAGIMDAPNAVRSSEARLTATLLADGRVLVAGDDEVNGSNPAFADLYDPGSGTWTSTGRMIGARDRHTATLLRDGKVLVTGGWDDLANLGNGAVATLASAEFYDPNTSSWIDAATMDTQRALHTATLLPDGSVLVAGGTFFPDRSDELATTELYDPGPER